MSYTGLVERELEAALCAPDWAKSLTHVHAAIEALTRSVDVEAVDCPLCATGRGSFTNPHKEFCDEHYRQYLLTFQIRPADLAEYRAKALAARETPHADS